jgi:hypothetical protein
MKLQYSYTIYNTPWRVGVIVNEKNKIPFLRCCEDPSLEQRADIETMTSTLRHAHHNTTASHLHSATIGGHTPGKRF